MSVKLTTNLSQRLVLTPQLRQRIEMLQMTSLELGDLIQQQLLENPILEEVVAHEETRQLAEEILDHQASGNTDFDYQATSTATDGPELNGAATLNGATTTTTTATAGDESAAASAASAEHTEDVAATDHNAAGADRMEGGGDAADAADADRAEGAEAGEEPHDAFEEIDYGREFQEYLDPGYKTQEFEYKEDAPTFEQFLTRPPSLGEHLEWQLHMSHVEEELLEAAECVIGNLDSDGRLSATNEEIAQLGGWSEEVIDQARAIVMRLDPVGCAARDLRECLLVQIAVKEASDRLAARLISDHQLADLQQHKLPNLVKQIGVPVETLLTELEFIRTLDPYPGRRYAADDPILIAPEIFIEKVADKFEISFADDGSPRLRVSASYQQMIKRSDTSKETKDFIKDKVRSAVDLLRNIEHRYHTILKIVECIVQRQRAFLDYGVAYIKPMMLKDIAEETGMHLSTVSRVVNRKYAHTPQGVIELRRFFTEGMTNEDGEEVSTRIIKLRIKKLIEEEDTRAPITDDQVVKILVKEGIKLSRRTVAKYRDQMQIPGSRERRTVV